MRLSRKDKLYLTLIIFLLVMFFTFPFLGLSFINFILFEHLILLVIFFWVRKLFKSYEAEVSYNEQVLDLFKKYYSDKIDVVSDTCKLIYGNISSDQINKYGIRIEDDDSYLLKFNDNMKEFLKFSDESLNDANNVIACFMDALVSSWKIKASSFDKSFPDKTLIEINCKLAVYAVFSIFGVPYKKMDESLAVKKLIDILFIYYVSGECGKISTLLQEAFYIELLLKD